MAEPPVKLYQYEQAGRVRRIYFDITLDGEIGTTDSIKLARLPKNSVPIAFKIYGPAASSGVVNVGWDAGANSLETADADGFVAAADISSELTLNYNSVNNTLAGLQNKRFEDDVTVVMTASTITSGWDTDTIKGEILYIND